MHDLRK